MTGDQTGLGSCLMGHGSRSPAADVGLSATPIKMAVLMFCETRDHSRRRAYLNGQLKETDLSGRPR